MCACLKHGCVFFFFDVELIGLFVLLVLSGCVCIDVCFGFVCCFYRVVCVVLVCLCCVVVV